MFSWLVFVGFCLVLAYWAGANPRYLRFALGAVLVLMLIVLVFGLGWDGRRTWLGWGGKSVAMTPCPPQTWYG